MSHFFAIFWAYCLLTECHVFISGFNVDTGLSRVISGQKGSHFGYTVGIVEVNGEIRIISGAPKANSTIRSKWIKSGAVYACPVTQGGRCGEIDMGETGHETAEGVMGEFLGGSLDVWTSRSGGFHRLLACAPLWKNTNFQDEFLAQGRCHEVGYKHDVTFQKVYQPMETRLSHDEQVTPDNVFLKAMGQAGVSAQFFKDNSAILVGAPGLFNWRGGVAFIRNDSRPNYLPYWLEGDFSGDMYAGYSVGSGVFFSDLMAYSVTGVPRWNGVGKVIIFDQTFHKIITERQGGQVGEYFGASLCVTNFNGDTYDDLLVGAPLYSEESEEGRVYAYVSRGLSVIATNQILRGPNKYRARFGASIAGIGDIDKDGYNDVAVGAPFADGMRGAVYIYRGSYSGLTRQFSQEILGRTVDPGLRGFGWALSKPLDADGNEYEDFAVGSFLSDQVVLLKTRPVAKVRASINLERDVINLLERSCHHRGQPHVCIQLDVVFLYTGHYVPDDLEIEYELLSDTRPDEEYEVGRAQIMLAGGGMSSVVFKRLRLEVGVEVRHSYMIIIKPKIDTFTDVVFELNFNKTVFCPPRLDRSRCPVLDTVLPRAIRRSVSFRKDCKSDRGCISDLKLLSTCPKSLLVGGQEFLTIKVIVTNRGEAAYVSMVTMRCQDDIKVAAVDTIDVPRDNPEGIKDIRCSSSRITGTKIEAAKTVLECNVGNPLRTGNIVVFLIKLDVRGIVPQGKFTVIELEATTKSTESNATRYDNYQTLRIALHKEVQVETSGISKPEQLTYRKQKAKNKQTEKTARLLHLIHSYRVANVGKSTISDVRVNLSLPLWDRQMAPLYQVSTVEIHPAKGKSRDVSGGCLTNHLPSFDITNTSSHLIGPDEPIKPTVSGQLQHVYVNCSTAVCLSIPCRLVGLRPGAIAVLTIHGRILEQSLLDMKVTGMINIQTNATIWVEDDAISSETSFTKTSLVINTEVYPQVLRRSRVNEWLLVVCISGGVILLMFLCLALWRAGFFRRVKQEELQRLLSVADSSAPSDSGRGTNSTSTDNETGIPEDISSAAGNTDSEPPESPRYPDDVDFDTLSRSTKKDTKNFIFDRPDRAFSNLTYDEAAQYGTRV